VLWSFSIIEVQSLISQKMKAFGLTSPTVKGLLIRKKVKKGKTMKTKKYWILAAGLGLCVVVLAAVRVRAGYIVRSDREVLAGIGSFELELVMPRGEIAHGLDYKEVERNIKGQLRAYGIKVFGLLDRLNDPNTPRGDTKLLIRMDGFWPLAVSSRDKWYSYSIRIFVLQYAHLLRDPKILFEAVTWEHSFTSCCSEEIFVAEVESRLRSELDGFIKNYLAANQMPKNEVEK